MAACLEVHSVYASDAEGSVVGSHAPYVGDQCRASECVTKPRVATQGRAHLAAFSRPATWLHVTCSRGGGVRVAASMRTGRPVIRPLTDQGDEMPWFGRRAV